MDRSASPVIADILSEWSDFGPSADAPECLHIRLPLTHSGQRLVCDSRSFSN